MNELTIDVNTQVLGTWPGALVRIERATAQAGVYAEIGTVAIVAGQPTITYYDEAGTTAHWYKVRSSNAANTKQTEYSAPFQAVSVGYTSVAEVKARLGMGTAAGTADALLATIVAEVNSWLDGRIGRHVGPGGSATRTYDGDGSTVLYVADGVQEVYGLTLYDGTRGASTVIAATDYYVDPPVHQRRPGEPAFYVTLSPNPAGPYSRYPLGKRTVEISALWGWPAVPLELQAVATKCAVADWRGRASAGGDQFTVGINGERTYERYLSYEDRKTVERYAADVPGIS